MITQENVFLFIFYRYAIPSSRDQMRDESICVFGMTRLDPHHCFRYLLLRHHHHHHHYQPLLLLQATGCEIGFLFVLFLNQLWCVSVSKHMIIILPLLSLTRSILITVKFSPLNRYSSSLPVCGTDVLLGHLSVSSSSLKWSFTLSFFSVVVGDHIGSVIE